MSITAMEGSIFIQPGGPNTPVRYLGSCHKLTGISWNRGTNTLLYCGDPIQPNAYKVKKKTKGPPGQVTYSIESQVEALISYIENLNCPVPIIVTSTPKSPKNDDTNWDRAWILPNSDNVQLDWANLVGTDANDPTTRTTGMEADSIIELVRLGVFRDSGIVETQSFNSLFACDTDLCASPTNPGETRCDVFYAVGDAVAGSAAGKASVWKYTRGDWEVFPTDPFDADQNIASGSCFVLDRNTTRVIVARGTTAPGAAAEVAITDDQGTTWRSINVGSTLGEFATGGHSLFVLDRNHLWLATNLGRIYFSGDGGESWTVQENAAIMATAYNWIEFYDAANGWAGGAGDVIISTGDGGLTWTQANATGNGGDITCGAVIDPFRAWVGTDDGEMFATRDGGSTWEQRAGWAGSGTGKVKSMRFFGDQLGFMAHDDGTNKGTFFLSKSGGANWETIKTETNSGINQLMVCSPHLVWAVGEAHGGRAGVFKLQPPVAA